jgi:hypothetical protein
MKYLEYSLVNINNTVSEYSDKITLFNAKEKLLNFVKNSNVPDGCSNKWNFKIDIEYVKLDDEERFANVN